MTREQAGSEEAVSDEPQDQDNEPSSFAEWVSLGVSSTLLAVVLGQVVYLWVSDRHQQPSILQVSRSEIRESEGDFYVPFEVTNIGGETAESVQVVAELQVDGVVVESGEQIVDFLSSQEKVDGAFVFSQNPQQGDLVIRVASYQKP